MAQSKRSCLRVFTAAMVMLCLVQAPPAAGNDALPEAIPGEVRLVLPPIIDAVPGIECNLYYDNVILTLDRDDYVFDVTCDKGMQLSERWAYTPAEADAGEYAITLSVLDSSNNVVAQGMSVVRVVPDAFKQGKRASLLIVGASFTEYSIYPQHILDLSRRGGVPGLYLVGSRGVGNMPPTTDLRHEGYSGWSAQAFATSTGPLSRSGYHSRPGTGSPFVYQHADGAGYLDFARYCSEFNDGQAPDMVTIQVGTNDVFSADDESVDSVIDRMFVHYDALIRSIQDAGPDTRIGVLMVTPPSTSQDGFRNYRGNGRQTRWQLRRNQHRLMERMVAHFGPRARERVHLVPTYLNLDCEHHFPTWAAPGNARSKIALTRVNNGTHPSGPGYEQIGDTVFAWINAQLKASY